MSIWLFLLIWVLVFIILITLVHKARKRYLKKYKNKSIKNFLVQKDIDGIEWLNKKCQDVNIRLCIKNDEYDKMIKNIVKYMIEVMRTGFIDYNEVKGISGANIGIPLNIVIINNSTFFEVFFNPKILTPHESTTTNKTNCGSLCLKEPVNVERSEKIEIEYYDYVYTYRRKVIGKTKSLVLQHEVDHNNGILITDRQI